MPFTQGHALLIGIGTHLYCPWLDLPITVADAEAVAKVLQAADACGYLPTQVQLISNGGATKAGILFALDDLARRTTAADTVFLFFSGHGALGADSNYCLLSHDVRLQGDRVVAGTGVSEAELLQKLRAIRAERMLMIFNACHSGGISPSLNVAAHALSASNPPEDTTAALLGSGTGRIIVVACREAQLSYIGNGTLTLFTQALADGLRGKGVRNNRGFISAFSLYEHLYETVTETVKTHYNLVQEPELTVLHGVGPFAVALYKGASSLGAELVRESLPSGMAAREVTPKKSAQCFQQHMETGGGAYVAGNVDTRAGDFIGRDKIVHGDEVHGDEVNGVKIGNISGGIHDAVFVGGNLGNVNLGGTTPPQSNSETQAPALEALCNVLSKLYVTDHDARRIATDVGLDIQQVDFSGEADGTWHQLLAEAQIHGKVKAVVGSAALEYPAQSERLSKAYQTYSGYQKERQ